MDYQEIFSKHNNSEIFIAFVGAIGIDLNDIYHIIDQRLKAFKYSTQHIKVSNIIGEFFEPEDFNDDEYKRTSFYMDKGNDLREHFSGTLGLAVSAKISAIRDSNEPKSRAAYIINSLKHPEEVQLLRKIYSHGFFSISVFSSEERRLEFLTESKHISPENAQELINRDSDEAIKHGQHTADTFHLSDFFINIDGDTDKLNNDIWRILDLIFGNPYITPTFNEYAMYMAFSASLRSADLSRQVGAVVTHNTNILSTGANDIPMAGGGLYWPTYNNRKKKIEDIESGRDYKRGVDSNVKEKNEIISNILDNLPTSIKEKLDSDEINELKNHLSKSKIKDITEYGRVVHAEMEALLACARNNIQTINTILFCTTFPCHNCAKHIIASGVKKVVYIEPYPKSKAIDFHSDSISMNELGKVNEKVIFEAFVGVGPRSFFNLFSTNLGSGYAITRKDGKTGKIIDWNRKDASVRMPLLAISYLEREISMVRNLKDIIQQAKNKEK